MIHFPVSINIGGHPVLLHGLMESLGIFIGFRYYLYLKKKNGDPIESENRIWIIISAMLGTVLGSRILGSLENLPEWMASPQPLQYFWGNKTMVGGFIGGLFAVEGVKKIIGERRASGDLFVYPLLLAMILGRIGCFSAGVYEEVYGFPSGFPWAMNLGDGIPRHPATLYEILFLVILWITLRWIQRKFVLEQGALFKLLLMAYFTFRFLLDFIKPGWRYFIGLGSIQIACLLMLVYYGRYVLHPSLLVRDGFNE
jgi:prolipoprotein diacylglyceryltransferase